MQTADEVPQQQQQQNRTLENISCLAVREQLSQDDSA